MKLIKSLIFSSLMLAVVFIAGCNEGPTTSNDIVGSNQHLSKSANSAILHIFNTSLNNQTINIHAVTSGWFEWNVTWNTRPTSGPVEASFVTNVSGAWIDVDITGLVNKWLDGTYNINYGLLLESSGINLERFDSREGVNHPYIDIIYSDGSVQTANDTADAEINELYPDQNFGATEYLFAGIVNGLQKQSLIKFDIQPLTQKCATAYGYGGSIATCFLNLSPISGNNWGWTNLVTPGYVGDWPLYAGAGQCDISKGTLVGTVHVSYVGGVLDVDYDLLTGFTLSETHVWVGNTYLPVKDGVYQTAPGKFNYNGQDPVHITGLTGNKYVAAHAGVCWFQ